MIATFIKSFPLKTRRVPLKSQSHGWVGFIPIALKINLPFIRYSAVLLPVVNVLFIYLIFLKWNRMIWICFGLIFDQAFPAFFCGRNLSQSQFLKTGKKRCIRSCKKRAQFSFFKFLFNAQIKIKNKIVSATALQKQTLKIPLKSMLGTPPNSQKSLLLRQVHNGNLFYSSLGQPQVNKVKIFLPFVKFMKRPQTKFHVHTMMESQVLRSKTSKFIIKSK